MVVRGFRCVGNRYHVPVFPPRISNEHGQKLGPSGRPQVNNVGSNTREGANDAANRGSGTIEDATPKKGQPHSHTRRGTGEKKKVTTHYNYPG